MQISSVSDQLKDLINQSKKILVTTQTNPSIDGLAAALGLYQALTTLKKEVVVGVAGGVPVNTSGLVGSERVVTTLGPHNLVISFDYVEGSIEKVSYNVEGNKFNLVITPKDGMINPDQVQYSYSGSNFDLVFVVDTPNLTDLGTLFAREQMLFSNVTVVNIDRHSENSQFGKINIVRSSAGSTSEILVSLIKEMRINFNSVSGGCFLTGIKSATNNFSQNTTAETFESAAVCLRALGEQPLETQPITDSAGSNGVHFEGETASNSQKVLQNSEAQEATSVDRSWFSPKVYKSSET